jgi:hypothetical protein
MQLHKELALAITYRQLNQDGALKKCNAPYDEMIYFLVLSNTQSRKREFT